MYKKVSLVATVLLLLLLIFIESSEGDKEPVLFFIYFIFWTLFTLVALGVGIYRVTVDRDVIGALRGVVYVFSPYILMVSILVVRCFLQVDVLRFLGICLFDF